MGKKCKHEQKLGKALIRDRFGPSTTKRRGEPSMLHTSDINDGYDWGRLNLQSVTEESSFQEFLSTAQLAGTEFQAEKLNIKYVNPKSNIGLVSHAEKAKLIEQQIKNKKFLKIPRRPKWDETTTANELQEREQEEFLTWRRQLAHLQENEGLLLTPYEKNIEFWRQLWRVIERSDVIIQIVDARNPLLFRCEDLEEYVKEINSSKMNMILLNKADFLTRDQREIWANYFENNNVQVAFFSATSAAETNKIMEKCNQEESCPDSTDAYNEHAKQSVKSTETSSDTDSYSGDGRVAITNNENTQLSNAEYNDKNTKSDKVSKTECELDKLKISVNESHKQIQNNLNVKNSAQILTRDELVLLLKSIYTGKSYIDGITTIGLVGYPNVGKSSTINALMANKKVSVSATPGKTKHFQTLFLDQDLLLCDSPGLVMPSFVCTKAEMILNGILAIDQMRDHVPAITLLGTLIPRHIIEDLYGIMLPAPLEGEDCNRPPTAEEILNSYGYNRGFMTQNGQPDNPRSARYILKDFVNGKLLYCNCPPNYKQEQFHTFPPKKRGINKHIPPRTMRVNKNKISSEDVDKTFFQQNIANVHIRKTHDKIHISQTSLHSEAETILKSTQSLLSSEKPWKKINKHSNKKKREKARRVYAHLDEH